MGKRSRARRGILDGTEGGKRAQEGARGHKRAQEGTRVCGMAQEGAKRRRMALWIPWEGVGGREKAWKGAGGSGRK